MIMYSILIGVILTAPHVIRYIIRNMLKDRLHDFNICNKDYEAITNKIFIIDISVILIILVQVLVITIIITSC